MVWSLSKLMAVKQVLEGFEDELFVLTFTVTRKATRSTRQYIFNIFLYIVMC